MTADPPARPSPVATGLLVLFAAGLWLGLWVQLLVVTPRAKKQFDEYGLQLPALTLTTLKLSDAAERLQPVTLAVVVVGLAVIVAGVIGVRHRLRAAAAGWWLALTVFVLLLPANLFVAATAALTWVKLQEGLAR